MWNLSKEPFEGEVINRVAQRHSFPGAGAWEAAKPCYTGEERIQEMLYLCVAFSCVHHKVKDLEGGTCAGGRDVTFWGKEAATLCIISSFVLPFMLTVFILPYTTAAWLSKELYY